MSYSSDLKQQLKTAELKKPCCHAAYLAGLEFGEADIVCEKDAGCYLRGVFIACGSITDPEKHLYVSFTGKGADFAEDALIACGIFPLRGTRRGKPVVYLRESEAIGDFLAVIGATGKALEFMELLVIRSMKSDANRTNNAECANIDKSAVASAEVRRSIELIIKGKGFESLNDELRETAELRMKYPSLSLEDLRAVHPKPLSKSGLYHRLRRLNEIGAEYSESGSDKNKSKK